MRVFVTLSQLNETVKILHLFLRVFFLILLSGEG